MLAGSEKRRRDLVKHAHAWIFFGSDIGAPRQPNLIHASDEVLEQWIVRSLEKEGLTVNAKTPYDSAARGEARPVQQGGGRFVTLVCSSEVYHNVADVGRRRSMWRHSLATPARLRTAPWSLHSSRADAARNEGAPSQETASCHRCRRQFSAELLPRLITAFATSRRF